MEPLSVIIGLISGAVLAVITAKINHHFDQRKEDKKKLRKAEYEIFLKLSALYNCYFWFATNELHGYETGRDISDEASEIAFELGVLIRENEHSEFCDDLLKILYDESHPTYNDRWKHMSALMDAIGKKSLPDYYRKIEAINEANIYLMAREGFVSKAPGTTRFRTRI